MNKLLPVIFIFFLLVNTSLAQSINLSVPVIEEQSLNCAEIAPVTSSENLSDVCLATVQSEACKEIPENDLKSCSASVGEDSINGLDLLTSCAEGLFDSVSELVEFIWDVMKFAWSSATDSEYRGEIREQADAYMDSAKLYLMTEYQKAFEECSSPFKQVKALKKMGGAIANMIVDMVMEAVENEIQEFSCLNNPAKSKYTCQLLGDLFFPPAAALALIKKGPKALKGLGNVADSFGELKKKFKGKRKNVDFPGEKNIIDLSSVDDDLIELERSLRSLAVTEELGDIEKQVRKIMFFKGKASPGELKKLNDRAMVKLKKYFDEEGVPARFTKMGGDNPIVELEIDFSKSSDSPIFQKLKRYNDNLGNRRLKVSLQGLYSIGGEGVFQSGINQVKIGMTSVLKLIRGETATTLSHEYRHSMFHQARDAGKDSLFYGKLSAVDDGAKVSGVKAYSKYMSMEELYNHSSDIFDGLKGKKKLRKSDLSFVSFKAENVKEMSIALYDNAKEINSATSSFRTGAKLKRSSPNTIFSKDGHSMTFAENKLTGRGEVVIEYNGKKYVEPVVTDAQQSAFNDVVKGFDHYNATGDMSQFNQYSLPKLGRLVEDIESKNTRRARVSLFQYQQSTRMQDYLKGKNIEDIDLDKLKKEAGAVKQGVREKRKE